MIGVSSIASDGNAYSQMAHLPPDVADKLADQLKAAAMEVRLSTVGFGR